MFKIEKTWFLLVLWVAKNSKNKQKKSRSSRPEVFFKKAVIENVDKVTGKHLRGSLYNIVTECVVIWILQNIWKILNPICHVVVPGSIDFEDLAVVFSAHVYRENKEHVYLSGKIWSNRLEKVYSSYSNRKTRCSKLYNHNIGIQNKCRFCNTMIIL